MCKIQKYIVMCVAVLLLLMVASCNSVITGRVPELIIITPRDTTIKVATTQQYMAVAYYSDGSTANITDDVTWSVQDDSTIVDLDVLGLARAQEDGIAAIIAQLGDVVGSTTVTATWDTPVYPLPSIPVNHYSSIRCTACHSEGTIEAPLFPDGHANYINEMCEGCHPTE